MEKWEEIFTGEIPKAVYQMQLINGEKQGEFVKQINQVSGGYGKVLNLKHYIVITQNYNVDIVTEWEPTVEVLQKQQDAR